MEPQATPAHPLRADLVESAVYDRVLPVSVERIFENVLDWEHLPWLHRRAFRAVDLRESGPEGWRARIGVGPSGADLWVDTEVAIDRPGLRYVTRTLGGPGEGTEITAECPHLGGPLGDALSDEGIATCPWHGYRFDVATGRSADGRRLHLRPAIEAHVARESGEVELRRVSREAS